MDIPAPGEQAQVRAAAGPARRNFENDEGAAPFSAGGSFDPTAGIIGGDSGGEIQARGNKGLVGLAAAGALVVGILFGYVGNQITSKGALVEQGKNKGAVMFEEANKVAEMRKGISLKMADINKSIQTDPAKAGQELVTILTTNFDKAPQVDQLFGWQLAAVHPDGIKRTFDLYEEANGLKIDLGYLAGFVTNNAKAIASGGPQRFAVKFGGKGATLVELVDAVCGDPKAPTPCDGKTEPAGYNIRTETGGQPAFAPAGTDDGQVQPLSPEGTVYGYIVGLNPENNAKIVVGSLLGRINERLEAMSKAEGRALKALKRYSDDPNVDSPAADAE